MATSSGFARADGPSSKPDFMLNVASNKTPVVAAYSGDTSKSLSPEDDCDVEEAAVDVVALDSAVDVEDVDAECE